MGGGSSSTTITNQAPPPRQIEKQAVYGSAGNAATVGARGPVGGPGGVPGAVAGLSQGAAAVLNSVLGLGIKKTLGG